MIYGGVDAEHFAARRSVGETLFVVACCPTRA